MHTDGRELGMVDSHTERHLNFLHMASFQGKSATSVPWKPMQESSHEDHIDQMLRCH
jgi:hypothetical protein